MFFKLFGGQAFYFFWHFDFLDRRNLHASPPPFPSPTCCTPLPEWHQKWVWNRVKDQFRSFPLKMRRKNNGKLFWNWILKKKNLTRFFSMKKIPNFFSSKFSFSEVKFFFSSYFFGNFPRYLRTLPVLTGASKCCLSVQLWRFLKVKKNVISEICWNSSENFFDKLKMSARVIKPK